METQKLDMLGEMCPIPILKAQQFLNQMSPKETLIVITDHSCVETNLYTLFLQKDYDVRSTEVMNGIWEISICKRI